MRPLEHELALLADEVFPEHRDLAAGLAERLATAAPGRVRRPWRAIAVAAVVAVAALGAAFAVPDARAALLRWLGLRGVEVHFVDRLPEAKPGAPPALGTRVSLAEAARRAPFRILLPGGEVGAPTAVYTARYAVDEVSLVWGAAERPRLLLTEAAGNLSIPFARKLVAGTRGTVRQLTVGGRPALWIEGAPHELLFLDRSGMVASAPLRLDAETLLWQRNGLFLRLEGTLTLAQALEVADSLR